MQVLKTLPDNSGLPDAATFRQWLFDALVALKLSASSVSMALGLGKNTLSRFLSAPDREVTLGVASKVTGALLDHAQAQGVELSPPPAAVLRVVGLGGAENG